jgi:hypothetical protein
MLPNEAAMPFHSDGIAPRDYVCRVADRCADIA